ncbi:DUF2497 domain-containing protein [Sphingomonas bacterium]|uniref:DUF2497 domain-containing protein n=1 Tax=Sphingomonas bacterium TaxID=1895847 RepID=UPI0015774D03|nr:DUF2497 domain-containing protein [Sphingomonas bacterium]
MGEISVEPSMEDILSSIKRIIAEEGDGAPGRTRRPPRTPAPRAEPVADRIPDDEDADDHVLELSDPMPIAKPEPAAVKSAPAAAAKPASESLVSREAVAASRGALDQLSRLIVKPEPDSDGTLEGLVRGMLRPMLSDWLDAHLPEMVEAMVAREIAKITDQAG